MPIEPAGRPRFRGADAADVPGASSAASVAAARLRVWYLNHASWTLIIYPHIPIEDTCTCKVFVLVGRFSNVQCAFWVLWVLAWPVMAHAWSVLAYGMVGVSLRHGR